MMKKFLAFSLLIYFPMSLISADKRQVKEDQAWGKEQVKHWLEGGWTSEFGKDDALPEKDKGKEFDLSNIKSKEIEQFTAVSAKRKQFEGTETLFQLSQAVLDNPNANIGVISAQTQTIPQEEKLGVCQEEGNYQITFLQKRIAQALPAVKEQIKSCKGHFQLSEHFFWESSAEGELKRIKKELSKDLTLKSFNANISEVVGFKKYAVVSQWKHKDNSTNCRSYLIEENLIQSASETDLWETDYPESLSVVEGNPSCKLLYSQVVEGPGVRMIEGQAVFRDTWFRQLLFSCEPNADSPCAKLRAQGGILTKKRCLKSNLFGECDLWEKTYDLAKKAAHREDSHIFEGEKIWGLSGVFDSSYEKNNEIGTAVSTLSIFSDIKNELEKSGREFGADVEIFRGERMQCQCSFIQGALYDCCKKMDGLAVSTYLARCTSEEQSLAERRHAGQCHHVGSQKENLNTQTAQIFCCFPTKLARILHEQGREQLGIKWGKAEAPECRGFSLSELQQVDFTKIDLSDVIEDLTIDKEELLNKVRSTIDHLQSTGQSEGKINTDKAVQQQEMIKNGS